MTKEVCCDKLTRFGYCFVSGVEFAHVAEKYLVGSEVSMFEYDVG